MRIPVVAGTRFVFGRGILVLLSFAALCLSGGQTVAPAQLAGLKWRNIGPFRGGRVAAVTGVASQPGVFYIGLPQGGVWKTTSAGQTWYPVFDDVKEVSSVGSVQVAQSDPNVVYAGTGEISGGGEGKGIYRSSDAGKTWHEIGLPESRMIPSLVVDPHDPNVVVAAVMNASAAAPKERGVFRSTDGGKSWTKTLFVNEQTGIQHLASTFDQPKIIYATAWRQFRGAGTVVDASISAGPEIYKSLDEGVTWKKLKTSGLPKSSGRMTVAVAQGTDSQRVYIIGTFGLYRSDDGGVNWRQMASDDSRIANGQGDYSSGVYVDPKNPDLVYTLATCVFRSLDGGKSFEGLKGAPGGDDPHQLWINPHDGNQILLGGDQGATVSLDAGKTWGSWYNQATGQVYHISTDNQFPYWVYATQQDSGCIGTSSRGNLGAITPMDWLPHPGNEGGYIVVDPLNSKISYAVGPVGGIIKVTYPSGTWVQVEPNMSPESDLRFGSGQMAFSPANPHELMISTQYLMSTTDGAVHWRKLSPDLTIDPEAKTKEEKARAKYASISSFCASSISSGLVWVGTSNGLIQVTRDHGQTWANVSMRKLSGQRPRLIFSIEASHTDLATAYVSVGTFGAGGTNPQIYRTHDFGNTWKAIGKGLPSGERVSALHSDTKRAGLLFSLTAKSVFVSFDDGDDWQPLSLNLPTTFMSDIVIHGNDLVLGTYGRGIWILDDISPLREISAATVADRVHLFRPSVAYRLRRNVNGDTPFPPEVPHAENPPLGAVIYYSLASKPTADVKLEILDLHGKVIRQMSSTPIEPYDDPAPPVSTYWPEIRKPMPAEVGLNRVNWNIRYDTPLAFNHDVGDVMGAMAGDTPAAIEGPLALPGAYTVRLIVDGKNYDQTVVVQNDPRSTATPRDLQLEHQFRMNIVAGVQEGWDGYYQVKSMRTALAAIIDAKPADEVLKAAKKFDAKLDKVGGTVSHVRRFYGPPQPNSFVGLNGYLLARLDSFDYGDMAPTDYMLEAYGSDWAKIKAVSDEWRTLQKKDLVDLNALLKKHSLNTVQPVGVELVDPPMPNKRYLPKPEPKEATAAAPVG